MSDWVFPRCQEVLVALPDAREEPAWMGPVAAHWPRNTVRWCRAGSESDVARRVERGGLSGVLVVDDRTAGEGLSVLRIIRAIDGGLPCWLITPLVSRPVVESAWALRVVSILMPPVKVSELTHGLNKTLQLSPVRKG